jgi:hypothetical protein
LASKDVHIGTYTRVLIGLTGVLYTESVMVRTPYSRFGNDLCHIFLIVEWILHTLFFKRRYARILDVFASKDGFKVHEE